jgi:hypothetical protein
MAGGTTIDTKKRVLLTSPLNGFPEIAGVLVRFDHVASRVS